jgi:hypothetical protein
MSKNVSFFPSPLSNHARHSDQSRTHLPNPIDALPADAEIDAVAAAQPLAVVRPGHVLRLPLHQPGHTFLRLRREQIRAETVRAARRPGPLPPRRRHIVLLVQAQDAAVLLGAQEHGRGRVVAARSHGFLCHRPPASQRLRLSPLPLRRNLRSGWAAVAGARAWVASEE